MAKDQEKVVGIKVEISGISNEQIEFERLAIKIRNTKKEIQDLNKAVTAQGGMASNEQLQQLAAYRQHLTNLQDDHKKLGTQLGYTKKSLSELFAQFQSMPGPIGTVASSLSGLATKLGALGPIGALVGGGLLAVSAPLISFFKNSEEGVELLERKVSGFKASVSVLRGELVALGKSMVGDSGNSPTKWGDVFSKIVKTLGTTVNLIPGFKEWIDKTGKSMNDASVAAENYKKQEQELEDLERGLIVTRAESNNKIAKANELYLNDKLPMGQRLQALKDSIKFEDEQADKEIQIAKQKTILISLINDEKEKTGQLRDEDRKRLQEAIANEIDLETASIGRVRKTEIRIKKAQDELAKGERERVENEKKALELSVEANEKAYKEIEDAHKDSIDKRELQIKGLTDVELDELNKRVDAEYQAGIQSVKDFKDAEDKKKKLAEDEAEFERDLQGTIIQGVQGVEEANFAAWKERQYEKMNVEMNVAGLTAEKQEEIRLKYAREARKREYWEIFIKGGLASLQAAATSKTWKEFLMHGIAISAEVNAAVVALNSQPLASGGRVGFSRQGLKLHNDRSRDNTLVYAMEGETFLNDRQVAMLGGSGTMRRIGVPGYADGGYVGTQAPEIPAMGFDFNRLSQMMNQIQVVLDVNKLNSAQNELQVINQTNRI
jgi:hypothetical protein